MKTQLFLITFDNPNFKWTVLGEDPKSGPDWEIDKLREKVPQLSKYSAPLRIWGVKPGPNNETYYEKMEQYENYLLFYRDGKYRWVGKVGETFRNNQFDQEYWVEGTDCSMLYTVENLEEIDLPKHKLNEVLEYDNRGDTEWNPQGIQRVDPSNLATLKERYGSLDGFVEELIEKAKQDPWWK